MRPLRHALALALTAALATTTAPATASAPPAPTSSETIPANVLAAGVDVSNLTVDAASQKLALELAHPLSAEVVVGAIGHVFRLNPLHAGLRLDALRTAQRAYQAGIARPQTGPTAPIVRVRAIVSHSQQAIARFVAGVGRTIDRAPLDASLHMTTRHMYVRPERDGLSIAERPLARAIDTAVDDPAASHVFHVRVAHTRARVATSDLPRLYPVIVTVDRSHFRLRLFKRLRFVKSYGVAVGRAGLATPAGIYHVQDREVNPSWHVPNASWAGSLAGQTIPPGPNDPIKARWLGLANGVGIHGTAEDWSIGSRASHGCIRMHISDVIELYGQVPLGTPVLIV